MIFKAFNVVQCYNYYVYPEHFKNISNNVFKHEFYIVMCTFYFSLSVFVYNK